MLYLLPLASTQNMNMNGGNASLSLIHIHTHTLLLLSWNIFHFSSKHIIDLLIFTEISLKKFFAEMEFENLVMSVATAGGECPAEVW